MVGYNVPSIKTTDKVWQVYALDVLTGILDGGDSARLAKDLIRQNPIASEVGANYDMFNRFGSLFILNGIPASRHSVKELQQALLNEVKRLQTTLVDDQELQRIKTQVVASKTYAKDSVFSQAMLIGSLESIDVPWQVGEDYAKNIRAVTAEQLRAVAQQFLIAKRLTIAELKPETLPSKTPSLDKKS